MVKAICLPEHSVVVGTNAFNAMFHNRCKFIPMKNEPVKADFAKKLASTTRFRAFAEML